MIDWVRVRELHDDVGNDEFHAVVELFLDEIESIMMDLGPAEGARQACGFHFMTGCARYLGFVAFGLLCESCEAEARAQSLGRAALDRVLAVYASSKRQLFSDLEYRLAVAAA